MKNTNANEMTAELTVRINKFLDRKLSTMSGIRSLSDRKIRTTHGQHTEVSTAPGYIALAIK